MIRKELQEHDWKVGEIIYEIGCKHHGCFDIPVKVISLKVTKVRRGSCISVNACNEKDRRLMSRCGYILDSNYKQCCANIFFSKDKAEQEFKKKYKEFKELHSERMYESLKIELNCLDARKQEIWGIMRMKIMKKDAESSNS